MPQRTHLDSGVLLAAWKAWEPLHRHSRNLLDDREREFVSSSLVELETLAQAEFHKNLAEEEFYRLYFESVAVKKAPIDESVIALAYDVVRKTQTAGIDAIHLAAAISSGADEFVTTEKRTSPLYRETRILVLNVEDL